MASAPKSLPYGITWVPLVATFLEPEGVRNLLNVCNFGRDVPGHTFRAIFRQYSPCPCEWFSIGGVTAPTPMHCGRAIVNVDEFSSLAGSPGWDALGFAKKKFHELTWHERVTATIGIFNMRAEDLANFFNRFAERHAGAKAFLDNELPESLSQLEKARRIRQWFQAQPEGAFDGFQINGLGNVPPELSRYLFRFSYIVGRLQHLAQRRDQEGFNALLAHNIGSIPRSMLGDLWFDLMGMNLMPYAQSCIPRGEELDLSRLSTDLAGCFQIQQFRKLMYARHFEAFEQLFRCCVTKGVFLPSCIHYGTILTDAALNTRDLRFLKTILDAGGAAIPDYHLDALATCVPQQTRDFLNGTPTSCLSKICGGGFFR